jgi:RNA polymerase sigma-70 factor
MNFNEKELRKLAKGDARAFEALHRAFFPKIHQLALMLLKDNQGADDVCQIVFMKIWLKRESLPEVINLDGYLFTLSKNAIIDYLSSEKMKNKGSDNMPDGMDSVTPHDKLVASDTQLLIDMVVENMPEQRQAIYRMSREQHLKNEEIATMLGIQKKTVENHLNLALKDIKKALFMILFAPLLWV